MIICASCLEEFEPYNPENHYCNPCNRRITKNSKRKVELSNSYEDLINKSKNNEEIWRKKGYIK